MTRIRYKQDGTQYLFTNVLVSKGFVSGFFDTSNLMYVIQNQENGTLAKGQGKNISDCKRLIKRDLKILGANFTDEIRNRGKTKKL